MFSSYYEATWQEVGKLAQMRVPQSDLHLERLASYDHTLARFLWADSIGDGGALDSKILDRSATTKTMHFSDRAYAIVPIYVTSVCIEQCMYCNFRSGNKGVEVERLRLSDLELAQEVEYLVKQKGLHVLELVYASDPMMRVDTMCRHVELLKKLLDQHGGGIVGINAEALEEKEYRRLVGAGLSFAVLWQETYDRERYRELHPGSTKKTNFNYRLDAYERMIAAGIKNVGLGILSGLADWKKDWAMLMYHEAYLRREYGVGAAVLGIPRLKPAAGSILQSTSFIPTRQEFLVSVALHNIFSPQTMAFVNTREDWDLCVELSKGGGCLFTFNCSTIPGGYSLGHRGYQFPTNSYDAPVWAEKLRERGFSPIFNWSIGESTPDVHSDQRIQVNV